MPARRFSTAPTPLISSELHARYVQDPRSVGPEWQAFFASLEDRPARTSSPKRAGPSWQPGNGAALLARPTRSARLHRGTGARRRQGYPWARACSSAITARAATSSPSSIRSNSRRARSIRSSGRRPTASPRPITTGRSISAARSGLEFGTLRQVLDILKRTYCQHIGAEYMHISDPEQRAWIQERIEGADKEVRFTARRQEGDPEEADRGGTSSNASSTSNIPARSASASMAASPSSRRSKQVIKRGGQLGVQEIVIGMPHRGRLNVLANVMAKPYRAIFNEFKGGSANPDDVEGSGDVKYHLGASSDRDFDGNQVHLSLTANPSHLEIVDPVVLGKVRAKQDQRHDRERREVSAAASAWRRGLRRPGRGGRMLRPVRPARPPHRRLAAFHRQQPDRLHHRAALCALLALSVGRREDDRRADLPREWRRSGSGGACGEDRHRSSASVSASPSSSTCSATAATAITRPTSRPSPSL